MKLLEGMPVFGEHDEKTIAQLRDVASRAERVALMADGHAEGGQCCCMAEATRCPGDVPSNERLGVRSELAQELHRLCPLCERKLDGLRRQRANRA